MRLLWLLVNVTDTTDGRFSGLPKTTDHRNCYENTVGVPLVGTRVAVHAEINPVTQNKGNHKGLSLR